jgi:prepilin-type processing-associated H-X9-DG protein
LVEILAVFGIVAVLAGLLVPAITRATARAKGLKCQSNLRTLAQGFVTYAGDYGGRMPPNVQADNQYWFQADRVGGLLQPSGLSIDGGVMTCPADEGARRSYAVNLWVCSAADKTVVQQTPSTGALWGASGSSQTILLVESWSGMNNAAGGYDALPAVGYRDPSPGRRFGAGGGLSPRLGMGRFGSVATELDYARHRTSRPPDGDRLAAYGTTNLAYLDGHVEAKRHDELADFATGRSKFDSLWSPLDRSQD